MTAQMLATAGQRAVSHRATLMVVMPLTMALLVGATGFFTLSTATRLYVVHGPAAASSPAMAQLGIQIASIALIAALIGLGLAIGVSRPVRQVTEQLAAIAAGDLRGAISIEQSTRELDSLGGAVSDALLAVQRAFFQSITGAVITLDAEGRVIGSSAAAEATLGYREEDLVGRRFADVFAPAAGSRTVLAALETAIARREPVALEGVEIVAADGRPVRIDISASYLQQAPVSGFGRSREVVGVTIAFKDLTQMRALQARLQQADQLMALGTVTAGVAHEIRNPLASIRGLAELIGRDFSGDDRRARYVTSMLESIDRLNRLIEELLLFSAPRPASIREVAVDGVIAESVRLAQAGHTGQVALVAPAVSASLVVRGDHERLVQVLTNIVVNAMQATPAGGAVTVTARTGDDQVAIAVHNTGSYIPPPIRRQLFVPFFTTKPAGTGLGLAIARQIVTSMDGRIEVASDPEQGTTFTIELPAAPADTAEAYTARVAVG